MGRVRPARGRGHVVDIRYLINLGASGEEGGLSKQFSLTCFPLHRFTRRVHNGRRMEHGVAGALWYFIALAPAPSLGLSVPSSGPTGTAARLIPIPRCPSQSGRRGSPSHPVSSLWAPRATPETSNRNSSWGLFPDRSLTRKVSLSFLAQSGQSKT